MEQLSFLAICAGIVSAVAIGGGAGAILGLGFAVDVSREAERQGMDPMDEEANRLFDEAFEAASQERGFVLQMLVLSLATSLISGGVTGWLAPAAPLLNAAVVGTVGTAVGLLSARAPSRMPRGLLVAGTLSTLPATLLGAWLAAG